MSEIRSRDELILTVNRLMICAMEDIDCGRNEASPTTLDLVRRIEDNDAALRLALETATQRIALDNAVCLCGCPADMHEDNGEDGEQCEHEDHECLRVAPAVLEIVGRVRLALEAATRERDEAIRLRDLHWREVESLCERLDKEEEKRGRQYGLRVQAEEQAKEAQAAARSVVAEAHSVLRLCAVPEQIPPFKTPLAPLAVRIMWLSEKRDEALTEVERLMTLVQNWYEGRARIGATMTFVDQRFYDSARLQRTGWPGDDADGDGGPPEE